MQQTLATFSATIDRELVLLTLKVDDATMKRAEEYGLMRYFDAVAEGRRTWNQTLLGARKQLRREGITSDLIAVFEGTADVIQERARLVSLATYGTYYGGETRRYFKDVDDFLSRLRTADPAARWAIAALTEFVAGEQLPLDAAGLPLLSGFCLNRGLNPAALMPSVAVV